jgi:hypothetical protein
VVGKIQKKILEKVKDNEYVKREEIDIIAGSKTRGGSIISQMVYFEFLKVSGIGVFQAGKKFNEVIREVGLNGDSAKR